MEGVVWEAWRPGAYATQRRMDPEEERRDESGQLWTGGVLGGCPGDDPAESPAKGQSWWWGKEEWGCGFLPERARRGFLTEAGWSREELAVEGAEPAQEYRLPRTAVRASQ